MQLSLLRTMGAAPRVALVLTAPMTMSTLATVAVYEAVPAGQEGTASCRNFACSSTPTPAGYQPVPADIDRSHRVVQALEALELSKLCPCVVFAAGRQTLFHFHYGKYPANMHAKRIKYCSASYTCQVEGCTWLAVQSRTWPRYTRPWLPQRSLAASWLAWQGCPSLSRASGCRCRPRQCAA